MYIKYERIAGGGWGQARTCQGTSTLVRPLTLRYFRLLPKSGTARGSRTHHAHEPDPPPPVGTGSSPSTAPERRGVEPLARARVLPDLALPPLPRARAQLRGRAVFLSSRRSWSTKELCIYPLPLGLFMLQRAGDADACAALCRRHLRRRRPRCHDRRVRPGA